MHSNNTFLDLREEDNLFIVDEMAAGSQSEVPLVSEKSEVVISGVARN